MQSSRNSLHRGIVKLEKVVLTTAEDDVWAELVTMVLPNTDKKISELLKSYCQSVEGD